MKRRDFLRSITALGATSAIPAPAVRSTARAQSRQETLFVVTEYGPNYSDIHGVGTNRPGNAVAWNCYDRLMPHGNASVGGFPTFHMKAGSLEKPKQFVAAEKDSWGLEYVKTNIAGGGGYKAVRWQAGTEVVFECGLAAPLYGAEHDAPAEPVWPQPHGYNTDLPRAELLVAEGGHPNGFGMTLSFGLGRPQPAPHRGPGHRRPDPAPRRLQGRQGRTRPLGGAGSPGGPAGGAAQDGSWRRCQPSG